MMMCIGRRSLTFGVLLFAIGAVVGPARANENAAEGVPTFNADIAPILNEYCVGCHRKGQVAPMSLTSYEAARPWARAVKAKVVAREMPPWFADPRYGKFKDVPTLSQIEIDTVAAWADGGAPQGDGVAPDAPVFASEWLGDRPPDYVLDMPLDLELPAQGEIEYVFIWVDTPWEEDVDLEAVQLRPGNPEVVHHSGIFTRTLPPGTRMGKKRMPSGQLIPQPVSLNPNEGPGARRARAEALVNGLIDADAQLVFFRPGGGYNRFPEGTAKRIYADRYLMFQNHYSLTGRPETDRSSAGFWFVKEPPHHRVVTAGLGPRGGTGSVRIVENTEQLSEAGGLPFAKTPVIPPHEADFSVTGIWPVTDDITIYGMWPHMHFRGKDMTFIVSYPDGTEETILSVPTYDFNWQIEYDLVEPLQVPAGSTLKTVGHFDNSVNNRLNPSPDREVHWGDQSWDEMFTIFTTFSVDKNDLSLEGKPKTDE